MLTDEEILRALEASDDEDFGDIDSDSDSEEDHVSEASDVEDELEYSEEDSAQCASNNGSSTEYYHGMDGSKWSSNPPTMRRAPSHNIIRGARDEVIIPPGKYLLDPVDAFNLYFEDHILEDIVHFTNIEANRVLSAKNKQWKPVDIVELKAFIGIIITSGHEKDCNVSVERMWHPFYGCNIYKATMGRTRFQNILSFLRFDDKNTRTLRRSRDKLAPIRDVWEKALTNLRKMYIPDVNITVDEQLVAFRGRCSFRQYIPSKPDKYGLKIFWVCDSASGYPLNALPYLGREGPNRAVNLGMQVVKSLCQPYIRTNRNVTCDNYFTSMELAESLLQDGLTIVGTLRKNKKNIPPNFQPAKSREEGSSIFGFMKNFTLVSFVPKKSKAVMLLSSMHHSGEVDETNKNKPEIITYYNSTKGGVDLLDQMAHSYTTRRKTNRWPVTFFFNIIDVIGIASYIIWKKHKSSNISRLQFLESVAQSLILPQVRRRKQRGMKRPIHNAVTEVLSMYCETAGQ